MTLPGQKLTLHTCIKCGGPRRSLTQEVCSRCRPTKNHEHDACPLCGGPKLKITKICIRCHAKEASTKRWSKPHVAQSRYDSCPNCGKPKMKEAATCMDCYHKAYREAHLNDYTMPDGRIMIINPDGPERIQRSRFVMEQILGRKLKTTEHVHHINQIKSDDRPENLVVMSKSDHAREHAVGLYICKSCGKHTPNADGICGLCRRFDICPICGEKKRAVAKVCKSCRHKHMSKMLRSPL